MALEGAVQVLAHSVLIDVGVAGTALVQDAEVLSHRDVEAAGAPGRIRPDDPQERGQPAAGRVDLPVVEGADDRAIKPGSGDAALVKTLNVPEQAAIFAVDTGAQPANTGVGTSALSSPTLPTTLGMLDGPTAPLAHAVMAPTVMEEWHWQSQLLVDGETTVDDVLARIGDIRLQGKAG